MLTYKKLPKGTPAWVTTSIFWLGGALGIAISVYTLIALYGLSAFLTNLFFPASTFNIEPSEAMYLGVTGVSSALAATLTSYLAVYMNGLSKKAMPLSRIVWIPALATTLLVIFDTTFTGFMYPFASIWIIGASISLVFCGLFPWLILRTKAGRKVHNR